MSRIVVLADMGGRHTAHDVYDLWVEVQDQAILFGWDRYDGGQYTFAVTGDGGLHPVGRPAAAQRQGTAYEAAWQDSKWMAAWHHLRTHGTHELQLPPPPADTEPYFDITCEISGRKHEFRAEDASLLFPAVCFDNEGQPWAVWVRCGDVENNGGVIDQVNEIECARPQGNEWVREVVADLRYGLQPKAGVWGYPGRRRRPYVVPDDRGGVWVMWERKEPHDGPTTKASGVLCGRRFADGKWHDPVRLVDEPYMDYFPAVRGVTEGLIVVATQKAVPDPDPRRGEVVVLSVQVDGAPPLVPDAGFEQWRRINLVHREFFSPPDRELKLGLESYQLIFGDPHTHTCLSTDAEGDLIEILSYARNKAKLDFVAITDNDYIYGTRLTDRAWLQTMAIEPFWSEEGQFTAVPAYEWTLAEDGSVRPQHRSILFESYDQSILRWYDQDEPMKALVSWIQTTNGIMNTQHAQFRLTASDRETNMEVCCGWGDYINKSDCFHRHLNDGFKAGFVGTSDGHRRTPGLGGGLTGLWVKEFTLPGIIEAFRERRCYATAGARIGLKFWINDAFMGQTAAGMGPFTAGIEVQAPREVESVEIFGDGRVVATLTGLPASFKEQLDDLPRCKWYYAKVTMPGGFPEYPSNIAPAEGPWAWSSPVFVSD